MIRSWTVLGALGAALALTAMPLGGAPTARADVDPVAYAYAPVLQAGVTTPRTTFELREVGVTAEDAPGDLTWDFRVARTSMLAVNRAAWTTPSSLQGVHTPLPRGAAPNEPAGHLTLPLAQGEVLCISARLSLADGRVAPWTSPACVVRYVDDRRLEHDGPVKHVRNPHFSDGRATELRHGSHIVLRHVPAGSRVTTLATAVPSTSRLGHIIVTQRGSHGRFSSFDAGWTVGKRRIYSQTTIGGQASRRAGQVRLGTGSQLSAPLEGLAIVPSWMYSLT